MIFYRPAQDKVLRIRRLVCTMHIPLNNRSSDLYSQDQLLLELKRLHLTISAHEACEHVIWWLLWNRTNLNHIFICCTDTKFTMSCAEIYTFTNLSLVRIWFAKCLVIVGYSKSSHYSSSTQMARGLNILTRSASHSSWSIHIACLN